MIGSVTRLSRTADVTSVGLRWCSALRYASVPSRLFDTRLTASMPVIPNSIVSISRTASLSVGTGVIISGTVTITFSFAALQAFAVAALLPSPL